MNIKYILSEGLFFDTDHRFYWNWRQLGLTGEEFTVPGADGCELDALFLKANSANGKKLRGTVFYAHDGSKNYTAHFDQVAWLVTQGFNVLLYDPRDCGRSTGTLSLNGMVQDAEAVYQHFISNQLISPDTLILLGQGIGAEALLRMLERHPQGAKAVFLESVWATHRGWLLRRYGPGIGHLCAALLPKDLTDEPIQALQKLRIPVVLILPGKDDAVPAKESRDMAEACPKWGKVWRADGEKHLTALAKPGKWREDFLTYAKKYLKE